MLLISIIANATNKTNKNCDWSRVMNAIIQVESKGNPKAHNPIGDCAGLLQIRKCLVNECNSILKRQGSSKRYTYADRYNGEKSKEMFVLLQNHFNKEHNIEKAIVCWNAGFYGGWRGKARGYLNKVMKYYNGGK